MAEDGDARRAETLFGAAMELDAEQRGVFLDQACRDDPELRREVDGLLGLLDLARTDQLFPSFEGFAASSLIGRQIGSYRILREIGEGGMGTVYLAEREDVGQRAALKLVRDGRLASSTQLQRFLLERRVLARLEHPNIARLLDVGLTEDKLPYLAMEYVEGTPITEYCDNHRLTVSERLHLYQQVCLAVQHAHQNLVVHRDLKPSNILVTESAGATAGGEVKLLDFGIAKLLGENESQEPALTRRGAPILTPEYASPEQVRGEPITTASDVYSLGVLLYELLSGHRPYDARGRTAAEVERVVCASEPERPLQAVLRAKDVVRTDGTVERIAPEAVSHARSTRPDRLRRRLAGDLDTIVLKALRKEPARRYASVEQLLQDIRRHMAGLIIPLVLYHGDRPWSMPLSFESLVEVPDGLEAVAQPYVPSFRYLVDDLTQASDDELRERMLTALALLAVVWLRDLRAIRAGGGEPVGRPMGGGDAACRCGG